MVKGLTIAAQRGGLPQECLVRLVRYYRMLKIASRLLRGELFQLVAPMI